MTYKEEHTLVLSRQEAQALVNIISVFMHLCEDVKEKEMELCKQILYR